VCDVKTSFAFKLLLILLIPLPLAWKGAAEYQRAPDLNETISRFLAIHGFDVTEQTPIQGVLVVRAAKGDCNMVVAAASPDEATRYIIPRLATTMDQRFVVFRGSIADERPTWRTIAQDWWTKFLHKVGLSKSAASRILVAATYSCNARHLPWAELPGEG
jgi:hypothetical protein